MGFNSKRAGKIRTGRTDEIMAAKPPLISQVNYK